MTEVPASRPGRARKPAGPIGRAAAAAAVLVWAVAAHGQGAAMPNANDPDSHMPERLRSDIHRIVVISGTGMADQEVTGTYDKDTLGAVGGASVGSSVGNIGKEIGGVPIYFPIPGVALPGAIIGGLIGATQKEIQDFRDALTEEIANAGSAQLKNDGLALDVFWGLRAMPGLDSKILPPDADIPADTDAVLFVNIDGVGIDVQGKEAVVATVATATLRRADGPVIYTTRIKYQDRDELDRWTDDDNALWRSYVNYARHYLGREIAADVYQRIEPGHQLVPVKTETAKQDRRNDWRFVSSVPAPTLAWEPDFDSGEGYPDWTDGLTEAEVYYDLEIYDNRQLVYAEEGIPDPAHTIAMPIEPCGVYRWSVRPAYRVGGDLRYGEWMRADPPEPDEDDEPEQEALSPAAKAVADIRGIVGREASAAPAYIQDFATLEIRCGR